MPGSLIIASIIGVDGCKGGWLSIARELDSGEISAEVLPTIGGLLKQKPLPLVAAIDIPIGLTDAGPRRCDRLARQMLGRPRASSVFPAPIRPALAAKNRQEANEITRSVDGRGVGAHAWNLYSRIREVDRVLTDNHWARRFLYEVHPEVSFLGWRGGWTGGAAIAQSKKSVEGAFIRTKLVDEHFGKQARSEIRAGHPRSLVADDDINDAFAALWTADRIRVGHAQVTPNPPEIDSLGIGMGIWY